jgi:hypothetical protein
VRQCTLQPTVSAPPGISVNPELLLAPVFPPDPTEALVVCQRRVALLEQELAGALAAAADLPTLVAELSTLRSSSQRLEGTVRNLLSASLRLDVAYDPSSSSFSVDNFAARRR